MTWAYYNDNEPFVCAWLKNLIAAGLIPDGEVDGRSIVDVRPADVAGFTQVHFFAGIGGWAYALRLAGWADDRFIWTGSCPCQPFSLAGKGLGDKDPRHLWPEWFRLIRECRPVAIAGEQTFSAIGHGWLDRVFDDLEGEGYACGAVGLPACAVGAPHRRERLWFLAHADKSDRRWGPNITFGVAQGRDAIDGIGRFDVANTNEPFSGEGRQQRSGQLGGLADAPQQREHGSRDAGPRRRSESSDRRFWDDAVWVTGTDGKSRRVKSSLRLLAHGSPGRVGRLRAYGNSIVPQAAAEVIGAWMECAP